MGEGRSALPFLHRARAAGQPPDAIDQRREQTGHADELDSLRHDLHIVPDFPERRALSNDVQAIAAYIPTASGAEEE